MIPVDFQALNRSCEQAIRLTRRARNLDSVKARKTGEVAAHLLGQAVRDMRSSRQHKCPGMSFLGC
ncbi:MAG: hypothetical protein O3B08_16340 [Proteobacteria bacterium]|nr:hypothetical protein [Pseudomonadota bacterium]